MLKNVGQILKLFSRRDQWSLVGLAVMMLVAAVLESFGIGLVFPLMSIISNPESVQQSKWLSRIYELLQLESEHSLLLIVAGAYWFLLAVKNLFIAGMVKWQYWFFTKKRFETHTRMYIAYLHAPYTFHLHNNSATLMRNIDEAGTIFVSILIPITLIVTDVFTSVAIIGLLLYMQTWIVIPTFFFLGICVSSINLYYRRKLRRYGKNKMEGMADQHKAFLQGLGGIKDVQVLKREGEFVAAYREGMWKYLNAVTRMQIITQLPRLLLEVVTISVMVVVLFLMLKQNQSISTVLPTLSLFVMAGLRLSPSLGRMAINFNQLNFSRDVVELVLGEIEKLKGMGAWDTEYESLPKSGEQKVLQDCIELQQGFYRYPGRENNVIDGVSLRIPRSTSVAFVGSSGAGKTTLIDILLGLLPLTQGKVLIDGIDIHEDIGAWRKQIGYVPQFIYICDDTVRRNVAFGIPAALIDEKALNRAIQAAQLDDVVEELPQGLDTLLGERGVRLSGGQRQRIGIARALYHNPEVLILDEATSSLDGETESEVASAIEKLSGEKTLIIIAHRLSTVRHCDQIYLMEGGRVIAEGCYQSLMEKNVQFRKMAGLGA
jgi:ATP-binding cassette, subfamily B, bacterial PglK